MSQEWKGSMGRSPKISSLLTFANNLPKKSFSNAYLFYDIPRKGLTRSILNKLHLRDQ